MKFLSIGFVLALGIAACGSKQSPAPSASDTPAGQSGTTSMDSAYPAVGLDAGIDGDFPGTPDPDTIGDLPQ